MVSLFYLNTMKKPLLPIAVACLLPVVSHVASARVQAVDVYVSRVSMSFPDPFPDPAEGNGFFKGEKDVMEITLGFVAPEGYRFLENEGVFKIGVKDAAGVAQQARFDSLLTRISPSGASAQCPVRLKKRLAFPLELDGAVKMKVYEGVRDLPAQMFDVRKGAKFKVEDMEITVEEVMGRDKEFSKIKFGFQDTLNVKEIRLTDEQGGRLDVQAVSKGPNCITGAVPSCAYTYVMKKMPARMKAVVVVNKGTETVVVPVKVTVDMNAPSKQGA